MPSPKLDPASTLFFLCDVQTKFQPAIYGYEHVVSTSRKMIRLAKLLNIPVLVTTQNTRALGPTDPNIEIDTLGPLLLGNFDKSLFSMVTPEVKAVLSSLPNLKSIVVFGIESHVCVLQTVLSILDDGIYTPHVIADGVSSCNSFEIPIALDRMRTEGARIGTSESVAFQLMGDSNLPTFKAFSRFIKDEKERTKINGEALLQSQVTTIQGPYEVASAGVVVSKY
ncbi:Isochorismatase hydrolase [Pholiota conissans]|uniref:Isochorismatase hydrolase n=1 Tax=Pholiota conissans TaxID=109636 RepID=A0A9P6D3C3_9AGAR|nr:Isochorismatase hydrolase [Pholiota conissans]